MAHAIYTCCSDSQKNPVSSASLHKISQHLQPDNIQHRPLRIIEENGVLAAVINPGQSTPVKSSGICIGGLFKAAHNWHIPGTEKPDGSYALFRSNQQSLELCTDTYASRTIWYYIDELNFFASTSQRALVCLLGSFQPDIDSRSWMLSSGALGDRPGWDKRLQRLPPDSTLTLQRENWVLDIETADIEFHPENSSKEILKQALSSAIDSTISDLTFGRDQWLLPLSGGYDSRSILQCLAPCNSLDTATWGTSESKKNNRNDAYIAQQLSEHYSTSHTFYPVNVDEIDVDTALTRFIKNGEGLIDNFSAYIDGFKIWADFHEKGYEGIIRGDEAFGNNWRSTPQQLHLDWRYITFAEYKQGDNLAKLLQLPKQSPNESLKKLANEPMHKYLDRFYIQFYFPQILASLNIAKSMYCETINPLLGKKITAATRQLPHNYRIDKALFKEIVEERTPQIGFAKTAAIANRQQIMGNQTLSNYIFNYLQSPAGEIFPQDAIQAIIEGASRELHNQPGKVSLFISRLKHAAQRRTARGQQKLKINYLQLAFRAFIVCKTTEIFNQDANILK